MKGYIARLMGENEEIKYLTRRHWFVFVGSILVEILIVIGLAIITLLVTLFLPPLSAWLIVLIPFILVLIPIIGGIRDFLVWWNRQFIVTNRRVVQVSGIINKNVTDSSLEKVNDVKLEQSFFGRIFNYGDVDILTASELGVNQFHWIGDPIRFKTAMLNAKEELERGNVSLSRDEDIPAIIDQLEELHRQGVLTEEEYQTNKKELLNKL